MREESIQRTLRKYSKASCNGCSVFEAGIRKGLVIADNNPSINAPKNIVLQELSDEELDEFRKICSEVFANCIEEQSNRYQRNRKRKIQ